MTPQQMDEIEAFDNVVGVGDARLLEIVTNGFAMLIMSWIGDKETTFDEIKKQLDPWLNRE